MRIPKGFIKDSDGVYRRGNYKLHEGQIIKESAPITTDEEKDSIFNRDYKDLDATIREVLSCNEFDGPLQHDVYITKSGENYKISETPGKNPVAIVTVDNNVYTLESKEITLSDDTKALSPDKDTAKAPKQNNKVTEVKVEDASKITRLHESDEKVLGNKDYIRVVNMIDDFIYDYSNDVELGKAILSQIARDCEIFANSLGGSSLVKEGEIIDQERFAKLVKQVNDLELEQIKSAATPEDITKARELRNQNIDQLLKSVDLGAPTESEQKVQEEIQDLTTEEPQADDTDVDPKSEIEEASDATGDGAPEPTDQETAPSKAKFIYRPKDIEDLRSKLADNVSANSTYVIEDTVTLNEDQFNNLASDLRSKQDFLEKFNPEPSKDATYTCIKVVGPTTTLLIDNSGDDTPKYVAILEDRS